MSTAFKSSIRASLSESFEDGEISTVRNDIFSQSVESDGLTIVTRTVTTQETLVTEPTPLGRFMAAGFVVVQVR